MIIKIKVVDSNSVDLKELQRLKTLIPDLKNVSVIYDKNNIFSHKIFYIGTKEYNLYLNDELTYISETKEVIINRNSFSLDEVIEHIEFHEQSGEIKTWILETLNSANSRLKQLEDMLTHTRFGMDSEELFEDIRNSEIRE